MNELSRLKSKLLETRALTESICAPLDPEDFPIQSAPEVSPPKWHLAHTTWFFERFILEARLPRYRLFRKEYDFLFNSYYESVGNRIDRDRRGNLSRPPIGEILRYRNHVTDALLELIDIKNEQGALDKDLSRWIELGIQHEQQHQELLLMDIKHILWSNPLRPAYQVRSHDSAETPLGPSPSRSMDFLAFEPGVVDIGPREPEFSFDHEGPRHSVLVHPFRLARAPVSNSDYIEFMEAGGYEDALLWHQDGWTAARREKWRAPLYWEKSGEQWWTMTFEGMRPVDPAAPVCHISYYEASAYSRWKGKRLPTEFEWEAAVQASAPGPHRQGFLEDSGFQPRAIHDSHDRISGALGNVWEWTSSAFLPFPGYRAPEGALQEYNAKFMCGQWVLKGGSCATPKSHARISYRNFYYPWNRWQFSGVRLAD